jgi:hypothetical protein
MFPKSRGVGAYKILINAGVAAHSWSTDTALSNSRTTMYHAHFFRAALLLAAFAVAGCNPRVDTPQVGVYRAVLCLPGGDTPFGFEVALEQQQYVLYLTNDTERTRVSNVKIADGKLRSTATSCSSRRSGAASPTCTG